MLLHQTPPALGHLLRAREAQLLGVRPLPLVDPRVPEHLQLLERLRPQLLDPRAGRPRPRMAGPSSGRSWGWTSVVWRSSGWPKPRASPTPTSSGPPSWAAPFSPRRATSWTPSRGCARRPRDRRAQDDRAAEGRDESRRPAGEPRGRLRSLLQPGRPLRPAGLCVPADLLPAPAFDGSGGPRRHDLVRRRHGDRRRVGVLRCRPSGRARCTEDRQTPAHGESGGEGVFRSGASLTGQCQVLQ